MKNISSILMVLFLLYSGASFGNDNGKRYDAGGREIIYGPVSGSYYNNVRIISNSVGIYARGSTIIRNSVIEAPICVESSGVGLNLQGNELKCNLCVKFTGSFFMDNTLSSNRCAGKGTNRPDIFGW